MIYQIAYTSAAARTISDEDFQQILASARRNNPREGLTGMLTFAGGSFLQVLEGEKDAVERTPAPRTAPLGFPAIWFGRYEAIAAEFAYTIDADDAASVRDEADLLGLIADTLEQQSAA